MITIGKLLDNKSHDIWNVGPEDSVLDALEIMNDKGIGALVVMQDKELIGIVSERDYARKVALKGLTSKNTKIKDIMTRHVYFVSPDQQIDESMVIMTQNRIRHLPVMEKKEVLGMVSLGDVVKEIINEQQYKIKKLENYISWEEAY